MYASTMLFQALPSVPPAETQLREFRFLTGCWRAQPKHGILQEQCWSAPFDANMTGNFRQVNEVGVAYDFWTLNIEDGTPVLRLRHYGQWFKGSEGKDALLKLQMTALTPGRNVTFSTEDHSTEITYTVHDDQLETLIVHQNGSQSERQTISLARSGSPE